jgi:hypothetical protein
MEPVGPLRIALYHPTISSVNDVDARRLEETASQAEDAVLYI